MHPIMVCVQEERGKLVQRAHLEREKREVSVARGSLHCG